MIKQKILVYDADCINYLNQEIERMNSEGWIIKDFKTNYGNGDDSNMDSDTITILYEKVED